MKQPYKKHFNFGIGMVAVSVFILIYLVLTQGAHAEIYNPHPTPTTNSITGSMIINGTITNADINSVANISLSKMESTSGTGYIPYQTLNGLSTTTDLYYNNVNNRLYINSIEVDGSFMRYDTIAYHWPASQGAAGTALTNDGSGNLSWKIISISHFGTGVDGVLNITTGTTTLTSDMQYSAVNISSGAVLATNGYRLYVSNTLTNAGTIEANGGNGQIGGNGGATTAGVGGVGGIGVNTGTIAGSLNGASGATGIINSDEGAVGVNGNSVSPSIGVNGVGGGNGGTSTGGTIYVGGSGGTATAEQVNYLYKNVPYSSQVVANATSTINENYMFSGASSGNSLSTTAGSGSGSAGLPGGGGTNGGGGGGGAGSSGGNIFISVKTLNNTGTIEANGGNGGTAGASYLPSNGGSQVNGGGGGGGSGGNILIVVKNILSYGIISVKGGNGGGVGVINTNATTAPVPGSNGITGNKYIVYYQ